MTIRSALTGVALLLLVATLAACSGADAAQPSIDPASADVQISASNMAFDQAQVSVPAGRAFTIAFTNDDSMPHNVAIKGANGEKLFTGDVVTGGVVVYSVPALAAGSYTFICDIHPGMTGTMTAS
jgi:plastocyanin